MLNLSSPVLVYFFKTFTITVTLGDNDSDREDNDTDEWVLYLSKVTQQNKSQMSAKLHYMVCAILSRPRLHYCHILLYLNAI